MNRTNRNAYMHYPLNRSGDTGFDYHLSQKEMNEEHAYYYQLFNEIRYIVK